jgi:hypothetical protein
MSEELLVTGVLPRIDPDRFAAVLAAAGSPAAAEARAAWAAVAAEGVDPSFALALFAHESRFGTVGLVAAYELRNPGATRTSRIGLGEPVPGRGPFWRYPSWTEGFRDLARRLVDPTFVYRRQRADSVERIVPLWAPASDGNDPAAYVAAVRACMAEHARDPVPGLPLRLALLPWGAPNRPGFPLRAAWVTVHETANEQAGADAEAHRRFVHAGGGREGVSFHFVVDDRVAVQLLPTTENGWHAGDGVAGPGNRTSLAVELCVNADGDWERTQENGARLVAALCRAFGLGSERVVPHQHWSGKQCPRRLLAQGFERFRARVGELLAGEGRFFLETGQWVRGDFLAFWEQRGGLELFGYPLTGERPERCEDGHRHWVQWFERACFERHEELPPGRQVLLRRLGALVLAREGER